MNCKVCKDLGWVVYQKIINGERLDYGARCLCNIGTKLGTRIPTVDQVGLNYEWLAAGNFKKGGATP